MERYAPKMMELAPRDIVARAIQTEVARGRGFEGGYVQLDLRHLGKELIQKRLPGIRQICVDFGGLDPVDDPIPVQPGQHYSMGGVDTDATGRTRVDNLYAAGECACVSVHGANRLGGNSLLETVVFGHLVAEAVNACRGEFDFQPKQALLGDHLRKVTDRVDRLLSRAGGVPSHRIREELRSLLTEKVGIFRNRAELAQAAREIGELRRQYHEVALQTPRGPFNYELLHVLELESLLYLGEITARGALAREESRGSHFRTDHPERDDAHWLKHTIAQLDGEEIRFSYVEPDLALAQPKSRTY
jgi:succinate dehydrogenase / fumarate reductase flavoprotein subunit